MSLHRQLHNPQIGVRFIRCLEYVVFVFFFGTQSFALNKLDINLEGDRVAAVKSTVNVLNDTDISSGVTYI